MRHRPKFSGGKVTGIEDALSSDQGGCSMTAQVTGHVSGHSGTLAIGSTSEPFTYTSSSVRIGQDKYAAGVIDRYVGSIPSWVSEDYANVGDCQGQAARQMSEPLDY